MDFGSAKGKIFMTITIKNASGIDPAPYTTNLNRPISGDITGHSSASPSSPAMF